MHVDYFEGILQLRNPSKAVLFFVRKAVAEHGRVKITKEKPAGDGIDVYLSDRRFTQNLGKRLTHHFGGQSKFSARLFSKDRLTSKDLYRVNVLFRLPSFKRGDTLMVLGRPAQVLEIKRLVNLQDIKTGKRFSAPFDRVEAAARGQVTQYSKSHN